MKKDNPIFLFISYLVLFINIIVFLYHIYFWADVVFNLSGYSNTGGLGFIVLILFSAIINITLSFSLNYFFSRIVQQNSFVKYFMTFNKLVLFVYFLEVIFILFIYLKSLI